MTATAAGDVFHYRIAGLHVRSAIELPAAPAAPGEADVTVTEGPVHDAGPPLRDDPRLRVSGVEADIRLRWPDLVAIRVHSGATATVDRAAGVEPDAVASLVLGVAFGLLLHQRGRLVLHASAVALPEGAVAFVGWKGAGKSTAAGALLRRGHPIVTDDALPVGEGADGAVHAWPGPAPLKLWPESAAALGRPPRRLPRLHPSASKRVVADVPKTEASAPLLAIYALDAGDSVTIERLAGAAGLLEVMRHAYAARFLPASGATPDHFDRCSRLARAVPVWRLRRPAGLDRLDDFAATVEAHASELAAARR